MDKKEIRKQRMQLLLTLTQLWQAHERITCDEKRAVIEKHIREIGHKLEKLSAARPRKKIEPLALVIDDTQDFKYNETFTLTDEQLAIAKQNGITKKQVYDRVEIRGWSIEDAITKPIGKRGFANNQHKLRTPELLAKLESNGITWKCFYTRIHNHKWDVERASTKPMGKHGGRKVD